MGKGTAKRRQRARLIEAQIEKKSMRRLAFKVDPSQKSRNCDNETESKSNKEKYEDFMPSTLRRMLSMKKGKRKEPAEGTSGSKLIMDHSSIASHNKRIRTEITEKRDHSSNQTDKIVSSKQSEAKRKKKEFLKAKEKKKKLKSNKGSIQQFAKDSIKADKVAFGEQAEQPLESSLKRKPWVEADVSNSHSISLRPGTSCVPMLDSKMLAAFYKKNGGTGKPAGSRATMQSLKSLLRQKEGESYA
eukprot:jgi/Picsp_1/3968/NSC_01480-R1_---NA---